MPSADGLPVIVLAAGRGTRMGGPKALMQVAGRPWWSRQLERLVDAGVTPLWVLSPQVRATLEKEPSFLKQPVVEADPHAPMFESVRAGVEFLRPANPRGVFVLPIDVPAPDAGVWRALADASPVAAPTLAGAHGHPVYLDWSFVRAHVAGAPQGARLDEIMAPHVRYIPVQDARVTLNLNSPEAVQGYERKEFPSAADGGTSAGARR